MEVKIMWICVKRLLPGCEAAGRSHSTPFFKNQLGSLPLRRRAGGLASPIEATNSPKPRRLVQPKVVQRSRAGEKIQHGEILREHNVPHLHGDQPSHKHEHDFTTHTH